MIATCVKTAAALIVALAVVIGGGELQAERPSPSAPPVSQTANLPITLDPEVSWNS